MNKSKLIEAIVWTFALGATLGSMWAWMLAVPDVYPENGITLQPVPLSHPIDIQAIQRAAEVLRDRNPFRVARRPTSVRFGSEVVEMVPEPVEIPSHGVNLSLSLAGIVGGPPWMALIEGIPGHESGAVLIQGEEINGFRLESIRGDTAVLVGFDSTWVLVPKQVWR